LIATAFNTLLGLYMTVIALFGLLIWKMDLWAVRKTTGVVRDEWNRGDPNYVHRQKSLLSCWLN